MSDWFDPPPVAVAPPAPVRRVRPSVAVGLATAAVPLVGLVAATVVLLRGEDAATVVASSPAAPGPQVARPMTPPAASTSPAEPPSVGSSAALSGVPLMAGTFSGTFTVVEDSSRAPQQEGESDDLVGTTFERTFVLAPACDDDGADCEISHESLAVYAPEPFSRTWRWPAEASQERTATITERRVDNCVNETDLVVGDFDTAITQTIILGRAAPGSDGALEWSTAGVSYVEDAVSDDTAEGCYTSRFRAEGVLHRNRGY